jgi:hypothetical protein
LAPAALAFSYSYSYSESLVYGTTNNAASGGLTWDMKDVLPVPGGLMINGMIYRYTIEKEVEANAKVHIQNENALGEGYIVRETDDWSNLPGSTINKLVKLSDIPMEYFGSGSIEVEGEASVVDPSVVYSYKMDPCFVPLSDPSCPGFAQALYDWMKENGLLPGDATIDDPFFNEFVQAALDQEVNLDEEDVKTEEEKEEDEQIEKLNAGASVEALADPAAQAAIMQALSTIPNFDQYYAVNIQGGVYEEALILEDAELPDNASAMRNLAQDTLHRSMVRSQYD